MTLKEVETTYICQLNKPQNRIILLFLINFALLGITIPL